MRFFKLAFKSQIRAIRLNHLWLSLVFAVLMISVYPTLQLDRFVTDLFFDADLQQFPLKHHPFFEQWAHTNLKWLMVLIALGSLLVSGTGYWVRMLKPYQSALLWVFVGMLVSTTTVAILKHYNQHGCPWDLVMYGGDLPFFELFSNPLLGVEAGRCFPAGHPSGGFALLAFYFAFIHSSPRFANCMLWLALFTGLLMGLAQIMRGAHFLSHVLWSGWVVWVSLLVLYWIWPPSSVPSVKK